jgi:hypothetical protein
MRLQYTDGRKNRHDAQTNELTLHVSDAEALTLTDAEVRKLIQVKKLRDGVAAEMGNLGKLLGQALQKAVQLDKGAN